MKRKSRRKLFFFLVLVFAAISPLLIAYSVGYKINFSRGSFEKTGGVFIKSRTSRLSLFLNGTFTKETSLLGGGAILTDLKPNTYLLRIEKAGYQPWSKTVKVEGGTVTELRNLLLLPQKIVQATSTREETALLEKSLVAQRSNRIKNLSSGIKVELNKNGELVEKEPRLLVLTSQVHSFEIIDDKILFVDKNGFLARLDPQEKKIEIVGHPGFFLKEEPFKFIQSSLGTISMIDSMGGVFILDNSTNTILTIDGDVKDVSFDKKGEKLLLVKENSINILWLAGNPQQPFQKKGIKEEVLKTSAPLRGANWFYGDNAHIALRTTDGIFFIELDGRGGRNTFELIPGKTEELMTIPEIPETIFFKKGKSWHKIEI